MWGPLVLAGDLGPRHERNDSAPRIVAPALVAADRPIEQWVVASGARVGDFRATGIARAVPRPNDQPADVSLTPFYRTHGRTYSVYFDILTTREFDARVASRAADAERQRRLESATIALVQPGEPAAEKTFNYRSEPADRPVTRTNSRTGRGGVGWFSFDVPVEPSSDMAVVVTYHNDLGLPVLANFEILADGTSIARYSPNRSAAGFWSEIYRVPAALVRSKRTVTVRFQAGAEGRIAPVYGVRVIRMKDA
jgi:hypothetical protein